MPTNLVKGQRIEIGLTRLKVEIGWKFEQYEELPSYELDGSAILLGNCGKIDNEFDLVYYNSKNTITDTNGNVRSCSLDKSVLGHSGSYDEMFSNDGGDFYEIFNIIDVDLTKTSLRVNEILFVATIYYNDKKGLSKIGQVHNFFVCIKNAITGEILCRYDLDVDCTTFDGVELGRLYRRGSDWKFEAMGNGIKEGLQGLVNKYL